MYFLFQRKGAKDAELLKEKIKVIEFTLPELFTTWAKARQ